ncbi:polyphosphate kinase 1 [Natronogracilivirga saccharolytica]|uniref:Polyphosphate kinase n=1 Tax=Natronogracilivirga saccharolytica TaxID=2812953 RepID=A0A8J7S414_9BACT|nr:polyphosphate kinase 1 [Natronogracilivirga saccharolytica]MBP3191593.1 polyphosphate kinase 1 [Natronogracilivirga saccharolytica]
MAEDTNLPESSQSVVIKKNGKGKNKKRLKRDPDLFHNYEFSLLQFNKRVLNEALDSRNPLLERVRFIGIVSSNLDEFYQKRVGGLKRQVMAGVYKRSLDGKTPASQLKMISKQVKGLDKVIRKTFEKELLPKLQDNGVFIVSFDDLDDGQKKYADDFFYRQVYPVLTPLAIDESHPFPFISSKSRSLIVELQNPATNEQLFARVKVPDNISRWIRIPGNMRRETEDREGEAVLLPLEDLIRCRLQEVFTGAEIISSHVIRVTRNSDIEKNKEDAEDLLEMIEEELRERRFAQPVRLEVERKTPDHIKNLLTDNLNISDDDIFEADGLVGLSEFTELADIEGFDHLRYEPWTPVTHPAFSREAENDTSSFFDSIRESDILVHHPYHSFATSVERFVHEAADDSEVLSIKQTLYRTSDDSPHMHALIRAAENGKQVAVLVELKASFDEQRNIEWVHKLEKAGAHVAYGLAGLKIHSKLTVIVRREADVIRRYVHVGTGNYHPKTAQLYEDLGLFTADDQVGKDATNLFNFLTGYSPGQTYSTMLVAPHYLRMEMTKRIRHERNLAAKGFKAQIIAKMNSLEDPGIIEELYAAAENGVKIDLVVRGVCRLKTGIKGTGNNIRVHSVIGRFLEHSRVYYFSNGGDALYYIGSADWMKRNLDSRVEVLLPVTDGKIKNYLWRMLQTYLDDKRQRWLLKPNGEYKPAAPPEEQADQGVQHTFMENARLQSAAHSQS